ncbi:hypothetical protein [Acinetobacter sp. SA01]|jgi:hypothetical protein|uniref:hypothetical protein n=1 Tax=Acinetobacter sp. SA01 TaxID=1862567 RepID=UPI00140C962A|nr:hypothetical protein [Acinetobacter sp. SA01]
MGAIEIVTIPLADLRELIRQETSNAITQALQCQNDELLNVTQLCERIPGLTRHLFKKLETKAKLKNIRGKYSLRAVKDAMQSH